MSFSFRQIKSIQPSAHHDQYVSTANKSVRVQILSKDMREVLGITT